MASKGFTKGLPFAKWAWHTYPDMCLNSAAFLLGCVALGRSIYLYRKDPHKSTEIRWNYTVIRDTDVKDPERAAKYFN